MNPIRILLLALLLALPMALTALPACSTLRSPEPDTNPQALRAPEDFCLSLTMLEGEPGSGPTEPAWYIVEPDGILRAASGSRTAFSPMPPTVRRLSRPQVDALYTICSQAGLLNENPKGFEAAPEAPSEAPDWTASPEAILATNPRTNRIYLAHSGRRRSYIPAVGTDAATGIPPTSTPTLEPLAAQLRAFAWMDK